MFGWFSDASVFASRWNRARRSGSCANASGRTLIATSTIELRVGRAIDLAHAARPEGGEDLYGPRRAPSGRVNEWHRCIYARQSMRSSRSPVGMSSKRHPRFSARTFLGRSIWGYAASLRQVGRGKVPGGLSPVRHHEEHA